MASLASPSTRAQPRSRWESARIQEVTIEDSFWSPRRATVRTQTIPQQEHHLRTGGQFEALRLGWQPGQPEPHIFWESDVAKWIEAASYCLASEPDPVLAAEVDKAIALLEGAQQPDGYLNVYFTVVKPGERFTDLRDAHELYCAGHLIEAGVAHFEATGKTSLLEVVRRFADLIDREFGPGGSCEGGYDGHQEIELALVRLYRATGERRYLELSRRLLEARGTQPFYFDVEQRRRRTPGYFASHFPQRDEQVQRFREYNQSHRPVLEQDEAVGHSVRAMYMYSAMADIAAEYDDERYAAACERLWESTTQRKLYLTGGIGADPTIEGCAGDYDQPDEHGYAETCAAIGLVFWAQRMANLHQTGHYIDILERALLNGVLSGSSIGGTRYFYDNPLASDGTVHRREWFGVACCPPNLARLISSLETYAYSRGDREAVVNLYVGGSARFDLETSTVTLTQDTEYPREGKVRITVDPDQATDLTVSVRIPAWCRDARLVVDGTPVSVESVLDRGYVRLTRTWQPGGEIELDLAMPPRRTWAHPLVAAAARRVALERGPLVYCLEGVDHLDPVHCLVLPRDAGLDTEPDDLSGLVAITAEGLATTARQETQMLYDDIPHQTSPARLRAIPYFSWANRERTPMTVWMHDGGA
jgi:DUF1680 family protein